MTNAETATNIEELMELCQELKIEDVEETLNMIDLVIDSKKYCIMKDSLLKALKEVEIWQYAGSGSNFTQKLIELIAKADRYNQKKLLLSFPEVVGAYLIWHNQRFGEKTFTNDKELFEYMEKRLTEKGE